jgi:hypothetical protein
MLLAHACGLDGSFRPRACALHCWVRSAGLWVGEGRNSNSCSFPAIAVASLLYIDRRQEHNNAGRIRQFGELYDRWSSLRLGGRRLRLEPLMRLEPCDSSRAACKCPTGTSRTSHSITRSCPLLGAVGGPSVCAARLLAAQLCFGLGAGVFGVIDAWGGASQLQVLAAQVSSPPPVTLVRSGTGRAWPIHRLCSSHNSCFK